jgi:hypothetical protein
MAANLFAEHQKEQLKAALAAYREMLDTFVNNQVPRAATPVDPIPTAAIPNAQSKSVKPQ